MLHAGPEEGAGSCRDGQGTRLERQLKSQQFYFQTGIFRCQKCGIFLSVPSEVYGDTSCSVLQHQGPVPWELFQRIA